MLTTQQLPAGGTVRVTSASSATALRGGGSRPHITVNPYSSQLVSHIDMMNLDGKRPQMQPMNPQLLGLTHSLKRGGITDQAAVADDYMYRSVSPHGHVYYEIDPSVVLLNQQQQQQPLLFEEQMLQQQQQQLLAMSSGDGQSSGDTTGSSSRESSSRFNCEQRPLISSPLKHLDSASVPPPPPPPTTLPGISSAFVRTGANRFNRATTASRQQKQSSNPPPAAHEQLQQQVQIRDCKAIQASVKSSEYIEAKIRTLRKGNVMNNNE